MEKTVFKEKFKWENRVPWLASQTDLLSEDWIILDNRVWGSLSLFISG